MEGGLFDIFQPSGAPGMLCGCRACVSLQPGEGEKVFCKYWALLTETRRVFRCFLPVGHAA